MGKQVITQEVAEEELKVWLDRKQVSESKRDEDQTSTLVDAVCSGHLVFKEDGSIDHTLKFPIENSDGVVTVETLNYANRLSWKQVKPYMKKVKSDDSFGMIHAHVCGLTRKPMEVIDNLEMKDLSVARTIAAFFLQ